eukprot:865858-Prorocentrum_minimum.AAC.1
MTAVTASTAAAGSTRSRAYCRNDRVFATTHFSKCRGAGEPGKTCRSTRYLLSNKWIDSSGYQRR